MSKSNSPNQNHKRREGEKEARQREESGPGDDHGDKERRRN